MNLHTKGLCLFFLLSIFIFQPKDLYSQTEIDFNHYQPLKCSGLIPEDFLILSQDKYKADVKNEAQITKGHKVSAAKGEFLLQTNFLVDEILRSGKVLFGDTVTAYVNRVADNVLAGQPELRKKLRFYCLKSSEANAFSTNQGIIFVTLGLIAQLENEAQLAFILSHEIAHYERHHSVNKYLENQRVFSGSTRTTYKTSDEKIRMASAYSKDLELEADSLGLRRLEKTQYDCNEAVSSLFVLQFSELPFEDFEFNPSFLENPVMKFPKDLLLDSIRAIDLENDMDDDTYSSHPNIATRRKNLKKMLNGMAGYGNEKFISSPTEFYTIRKLCRFEAIRIMLNNREYCPAFYDAYILLKDDTASLYLKTCIGKALYGMSKYKNHGSYTDVSEYYAKKEGNQQQVYHLFGTMKSEQLNLVALRYLYNLSKLDSSFSIVAMRNDLALEAVSINNIHYEDLKETYTILNDTVGIPISGEQMDKTETDKEKHSSGYTSKYDKLREAKKKSEVEKVTETKKADASKYYMLAFADIENREDVVEMFAVAEKRKVEIESAKKAESEKKAKLTSLQRKQLEKLESTGQNLALGIDTVLCAEPFYYMVSKKGRIKLIKSENLQLKFSESIRRNAGQTRLVVTLLDPKSFTTNDVDKYNDLAVVNDWLDERFDHEEDIEILPLETDRTEAIAAKYHTSHFCYTGAYTIREKKQDAGFWLVASILFFPLLAITIPNALIPKSNTYYHTLLYNTKNGKLEVNTAIHMKSKGGINTKMVGLMTHIKKRKKQTTVRS